MHNVSCQCHATFSKSCSFFCSKRSFAMVCPKIHLLKNFGTECDNGWACDGRRQPGGCRSGLTDFHQSKGLIFLKSFPIRINFGVSLALPLCHFMPFGDRMPLGKSKKLPCSRSNFLFSKYSETQTTFNTEQPIARYATLSLFVPQVLKTSKSSNIQQ